MRAPAARAHWWKDGDRRALLAGRDLQQGGTWLGVEPTRPLGVRHQRARTRSPRSARAVARRARAAPCCATRATRRRPSNRWSRRRLRYNGFNLVAGERTACRVRARIARHGVAGARRRHPWRLERAARYAVAEARSREGGRCRVGGERERRPRCTVRRARRPRAGARRRIAGHRSCARTRTPAVVAVHRERRTTARAARRCSRWRDGEAHFVERSFDAAGCVTGDVEYRFRTEEVAAPVA